MQAPPSSTAQRVALQRAVHQLLDDPKVFDDPLALRIIDKEHAVSMEANPHQYETSKLVSYVRAFIAARSRYAEDELALGIQQGVSQYVILGAGFDTFAYRNPYPQNVLHVFEVDHPTTQIRKRARLEEAGIALPPGLTFVPFNFETQTLVDGLRDSGYDPGKRTFFSWLGVTEYLPIEAVMATLRFMAAMPVENGTIFDYMISPSILTSDQRRRFDFLAQHVASIGEPWQTYFEPESLMKELQNIGFRCVDDNGPEDINTRYFRDRADGLWVGSLSHIMIARV